MFSNHMARLAKCRGPNDNGWQDRHAEAVLGKGRPPDHMGSLNTEQAMVSMLAGWAAYAEAHRERFDSPIGDDGVLGEEWKQIGQALRGLLNGECGRLDCGTVDGWLLSTAEAEGVELE